MAEYSLTLPLKREDIEKLRAGDSVKLTGTIYGARDAAHKRFFELLQKGEVLPVPKGGTIYYVGPCPAAPGEVIGPCGPTTSARMDPYTPAVLDYGVVGLIGKGPRCDAVLDALKNNTAVYFAATGGAGTLLSSRVKACRVIAFPELGTEAVHEMEVEDFPVIVAADCFGGNLYRDRKPLK